MPIRIPSTPPKQWNVFWGVNHYEDSNLRDLKHSIKSCQLLADLFNLYGSQTNTETIICHDNTETKPKLAAFKQLLERLLINVTEGDKIVFYLTGHGVRQGKKTYYCFTDTSLTHLEETTYSLEDVFELFKKFPAQEIILFLDTCYSGDLEIEDDNLPSIAQKRIQAKQNFYVLTSSQAEEKSYEVDFLKAPIFSYYLIKGLVGGASNQSGEIKFFELCDYLIEKLKWHFNNLTTQLEIIQSLSPCNSLNIEINPYQNPRILANSRGNTVIFTSSSNHQEIFPRQAFILASSSLSTPLNKFRKKLETIGYFQVRVIDSLETLSEQILPRATVLLYLPGKLKQETIQRDEQAILLADLTKFRETIHNKQIQLILCLDIIDSQQEQLETWFKQLPKQDSEVGQVILAYPDLFKQLSLVFDDYPQGITAPEVLKKLQNNCHYPLTSTLFLSGLVSTIEIVPTQSEQTYRQSEHYWLNLATKKLKQEQELSNNFLTLANKEQQKNLAEIYVSLELNDTQLDSLSQDYSFQRPSPYQPEEFFDRILAEENTWEQYRGITIIGEAGAGKTSFLQKLARLVIERNQGIPIFINLKKMVDEENKLISVEKYLYSIWLPQALKKPLTIPLSNSEKENFRKQLTTGRVWLFLDGLAEINAFSPLTALNEQLQDLLNSAQVKLIITCRQNLWLKRNNELNDFQCYYAKPYTPDQREDFINKFFTNSNEEGQQLIGQLNLPENDRLKSLVSKPLYLNLLCLSWRYNAINFVSLTQAQLYRYFIDSFKQWKSDIFYDSDKSALELEQKLGKLSQSALDDDHFVFRLPESWLANYLGDPAHDKSYFGMAKKLGWLNQIEDNFGERYYSFIHSSFQEYLAAVNIDDWGFFLPKNHLDNPIKGKTYRIFNKRWHPIFYLWLGREIIKPEKKLEFIQSLLNFKDGCLEYNLYGYRAVLLVGGGIRELKNIDPVKVEEISNQIEDYLKNCLDEELIFLAKRVIETIDREKIRTPPIINFLKAATTSKTPWLRRLTIKTLGNLYLKDLNFLTPLLKDEDTSVAQMAALVLNKKSNLLELQYTEHLNTFGQEIKSNKLNKLPDSPLNKIVEFTEKTILEVLDLMLEDDNYLTRKSAEKFLEKELNSCPQKRYEFLNIVKNQADKFLKEEKIADLIDICLQKMTYPEFYEGWNSF
jgi:hypothetical protein